jgi:cellulose synthase/poly-beta-1,6-N-acetylglucosamine synthase-like glycosyltransferase
VTTNYRAPANSPTVGVVVTACAASERLATLLRTLCAQTLVPVDILLVDNRPATSMLPALVDRLDLSLLHYVPVSKKGLSRARNAGLAATAADLVAFTDDDVEVAPDWLARLTEPFIDKAVACTTGLIVPIRVETAAERWFEEFGGYSKGAEIRRYTLESAQREGLYPYRAGRFGSGANAAFRRAVLTNVGGFEESLGAGTHARGGEDLDIFLTILRTGHTIVYQPAAKVAHASYAEYHELRRQLFGYGVGLSAALTKRFVTCGADRRAMMRTGVAALRYLLGPDSGKNKARSATYPRALIATELLGVAAGPALYLRSRFSQAVFRT